jgi:LAGLIDADG endonuclease
LAGFTTGEGCFTVNLIKSTHVSVGTQVQLDFRISQHNRDEQLIISLIEFLGCGKLYKYREAVEFRITKFNDLVDKVFPFFAKYPIQGIKFRDYLDFVRIAELMKNKAHITKEGLDQIHKIKSGMNTGRPL